MNLLITFLERLVLLFYEMFELLSVLYFLDTFSHDLLFFQLGFHNGLLELFYDLQMFLGGFSKLQDFGIDELFFLDDLEYLFAFLFQNQNSFLHLVLLLFHLFEFPGELFIDKFSVFELYFLHRDDVQLV